MTSRYGHCVLGLCALVAVAIPSPARDSAIAATPRSRAASPARPAVLVLAGGCYWGVESVYRHVRGVTSVVSGFATPAGSTQAAEAVRITYDPSQVSYKHLLDVFFSVVHDPTQLNRQGPDVGVEYRSIVFVDGSAERAAAKRYIDSLTRARVFAKPIMTEVDALRGFQAVDESQQNYAEKHPGQAYIIINDAPKLKALARKFPALFRR
jgi:peptide-methionine (S)-S-oxide reductase